MSIQSMIVDLHKGKRMTRSACEISAFDENSKVFATAAKFSFPRFVSSAATGPMQTLTVINFIALRLPHCRHSYSLERYHAIVVGDPVLAANWGSYACA